MRTFSPPPQSDSGADSTAALQAMLNAGPGVVHVEPGDYHWGGVTVPNGVTLIGAGPATVVRSTAAKSIFNQSDVSGWAIRDMVLDGQQTEPWQQRTDAGENGITTSKCWAFELSGITLRNFRGVGLQMSYTKLGPTTAPFSNGGSLDRITAYGNYVGVRFDIRAEYMNATRLDCFNNIVGCVIHAGNVKIATSNFCSNDCGVLIEDKENGSHGSLSNCLINHNNHTALLARKASNGMSIDSCAFFYGAIEIADCKGIQVTSGMINCNIKTTGKNWNRLAGNYIIPAKYKFEFSPTTIVEGNFTEDGPWKENRK